MRIAPKAAGLVGLALTCTLIAPDPRAAEAGRAARTPRAPARPMVLPFLHDDYARAVAQARARKVPLFVESWAPW